MNLQDVLDLQPNLQIWSARIYNMICNQIYSDSDGQGEETASSGLYHSYQLQFQDKLSIKWNGDETDEIG